MFEVHKAPFSKRFGSGMFDLIILVILATGLVFIFNKVLGYDSLFYQYENDISKIEQQYNIVFDITSEEYEKLSESEVSKYNEAYEAMLQDTGITENYSKLVQTTIVSITMSLFIACLATNFIVPIIFKEGRTLGKKLFGLCLISNNLVRVSKVQLFSRAMLGKFAVEIMVPAYIVIMFMFNKLNLVILLLLAVIVLVQMYLFFIGKDRKLLHDVFAQTIVVDYATQKIYANYDSLIEAKKEYASQLAQETEYK